MEKRIKEEGKGEECRARKERERDEIRREAGRRSEEKGTGQSRCRANNTSFTAKRIF